MNYPKEWKIVFTTRSDEEVVFRPEQPDDTEMLWEMFSTLSEESKSNLIPPFTRERIESWTQNIDYDKLLTIVAVVEEKSVQRIVGSASLRFNQQEALKHRAELGITIHDSHQNRGIGTALLKHLISIAKTKNLKKIHLNVSATNDRAINLYKKAGFKMEGKLCKENCINGRYRDEYRMALLL